MKKLLFLVLIPFVIFSQVRLVQTDYSTKREWNIYCTSTDSGTYAQEINLNDFDGDLMSYPLGFSIKFDTLTADASETEIAGAYLQAYQIDQWIDVDTLVAIDTLNGSHTLAAATFYAKGVLDANQESFGGFARYRVAVVATTGLGENLFAYYIKLYAHKRD